jgi:HD superfamily phosphohydrolase
MLGAVMPMTNFFDRNRREEMESVLADFVGEEVIKHRFLKRLDGVSFLGIFEYALNIPHELRCTRYDHALGVAYLTLEYCRQLRIPVPEAFIAVLAALIHDIGHGPFAHSIEFLQFLRNLEEDKPDKVLNYSHDSNTKITKIRAFLRDCYNGLPWVLVGYDFSQLDPWISNRRGDDLSKFARSVAVVMSGSDKVKKPKIRKMFNNPFCPDTFDGTNRACLSLSQVLNLEYFDPEKLVDAICYQGKPLVVKSAQEPDDTHAILRFHRLMKELYEDVIDSPHYRAAEAMLTRAADYAYADENSIPYSRLKDSQFIKKLKGNKLSSTLWRQIEAGNLFVPLSLTDRKKFRRAVNLYYRKRKQEKPDIRTAIRETELDLAQQISVLVKEFVILHIFRTPQWNRSNIYFEPAGVDAWEIRWKPSEGTPPPEPKIEIYVPLNAGGRQLELFC